MNLFGRTIEAPEPTTIKEAGFNYLWSAFLKEGLDSRRSFARLEQMDEVDEFAAGYNEAIEKIATLTEYDEGQLVFFEMAQGLSPADMMKLADEVILPDEKMRGFLEASQLVLESNHDLNKIAWKGPNQQETSAMNEFEIGKVAAYNALVDMAVDGATVADLVEAAGIELGDEDVKIASVEDRDYRLGVESVCHDVYVKVAELYGNYDTDGVGDDELVDALLTAVRPEDEEVEKTAADAEFYDNVVEYLNENLTEEDLDKVAEVVIDNVFELPLEKDASDEEVEHYNSAVDFLNEFDEDTQEKIAEVILDNMDEEFLGELQKEAMQSDKLKEKLGKNRKSKAYEAGAKAGDRAKSKVKWKGRAENVGRSISKNKGKIGLGLAGAGAAYGAKKLYDKRKAEQPEKTASDDKLTQAYNVLAEAGLLDD